MASRGPKTEAIGSSDGFKTASEAFRWFQEEPRPSQDGQDAPETLAADAIWGLRCQKKVFWFWVVLGFKMPEKALAWPGHSK